MALLGNDVPRVAVRETDKLVGGHGDRCTLRGGAGDDEMQGRIWCNRHDLRLVTGDDVVICRDR